MFYIQQTTIGIIICVICCKFAGIINKTIWKEYKMETKAEIIDLQGINEDLIHVTIIDEFGIKYTGALERDEK